MNHSETVSFIWNIANLIRDSFRRSKYPDIILPFTVIRRIDSVLAPTKQKVLETHARFRGQISPEALDSQLRRASGFAFYNISPYDFERLYQDHANLADNLHAYIQGFSPNMREVVDRFDFHNTITKLEDSGLLFLVLQEFKNADLHPDKVSNQAMGTIFEELIRKFNEASNENPGEHFTPPDVVSLMVNLLMASDDDFINRPHVAVTVYDPCCGTGGMLTKAKERINSQNQTAQVYLYGQEVNPETYAVCKSDLFMKSEDGADAENIKFGSTLSNDQHSDQRFNYLLANPPYGKDWRLDRDAVLAEEKRPGSRYSPGTPRSGDGQMLFLLQMIARMHPVDGDHSRMAIVMNGSPLFAGDAGSGESNIRRWILEHDWLESIISLPESLFYNTGIGTYIWVLTTDKPVHRRGKVQLIDATGYWTSLRKSLGDKRREISPEQVAQISELFAAFEVNDQSKIFDNTDFGFRKIVIERPLRLNFQVTPERMARLDEQGAFVNLARSRKKDPERRKEEEETGEQLQATIKDVLWSLSDELHKDRAVFLKDVRKAAIAQDLKLTIALQKTIWQALGEKDDSAEICRDKNGKTEPDSDLRDYERIPLKEDITSFFEREVLPYVSDAWINENYLDEQVQQVGRVGYKINFNRIFYQYTSLRPLEEIDADILEIEDKIFHLLSQVTDRRSEVRG